MQCQSLIDRLGKKYWLLGQASNILWESVAQRHQKENDKREVSPLSEATPHHQTHQLYHKIGSLLTTKMHQNNFKIKFYRKLVQNLIVP